MAVAQHGLALTAKDVDAVMNPNAAKVKTSDVSRAPMKFATALLRDGVLCLDGGQQTLEPLAMQALKRLCEEVDADVVLSTDWRRVPKLKSQLTKLRREKILQAKGVKRKVTAGDGQPRQVKFKQVRQR